MRASRKGHPDQNGPDIGSDLKNGRQIDVVGDLIRISRLVGDSETIFAGGTESSVRL